MSELRSDNTETKSPSSEIPQLESAKVSEADKDKLTPHENKAAKTDNSYDGKNETESKSGHPKLDANSNDNVTQPKEAKNPQGINDYGKLASEPLENENLEQTTNGKLVQPKEPVESYDDLVHRHENYDYKGIDYDEMDDKEFSKYADDLYDKYSGLNYDIHKDYADQIKSEQEKVNDESLSDEERHAAAEKQQKYQNAVDKYNETGHQPEVIWPENGGFEGEVQRVPLESGTIVSRYTDKGEDAGAGRYASPVGTDYEDRALPYFEDKKEEHFFRVADGESVDVDAGNIREFRGDTSTGATQYHFDKDINEYIQQGKMYECDRYGNRISQNGNP